jgi:predicted dithiol-disulfide oxidoreductase (DUF899 family)
MSMIPMGGHKIAPNPTLIENNPDTYLSMGLTAENLASEFKITREEQDVFALDSHRKALAAIQHGRFKDEIVPLAIDHTVLHHSKRHKESSTFDTDEGKATLADLFRGRSQLLVYHFMLGPDYTAGCPSCSAIADGFNGSAVHLMNHDVMFTAISRAPLEKIQAFRRRMEWTFPWASSHGSDFNYDYGVSFTQEQQDSGHVDYNFGSENFLPSGGESRFAESVGTDAATFMREGPGMSAFAREDGAVYHTYSAYARGLDGLWGMYQWLDRAPLGRNETGVWWLRHDEYSS